jgi:hypothetical protein
LPACTRYNKEAELFAEHKRFLQHREKFLNAPVSGNAAVLDVNHILNYLFFHAIGVIFASAAHGARKIAQESKLE